PADLTQGIDGRATRAGVLETFDESWHCRLGVGADLTQGVDRRPSHGWIGIADRLDEGSDGRLGQWAEVAQTLRRPLADLAGLVLERLDEHRYRRFVPRVNTGHGLGGLDADHGIGIFLSQLEQRRYSGRSRRSDQPKVLRGLHPDARVFAL